MITSLPHIAITVSAARVSAGLLVALRDVTGAGFATLKDRIAQQQPVITIPLFDNDFYDGGAARLRALVALLESQQVDFSIYELEEGLCFAHRHETTDKITPETLRNILDVSVALAPHSDQCQ